MSDSNGLGSVHRFKIIAGKRLLFAVVWSLVVLAVASLWRPGKGDPLLSELGIMLWWLASSIYIPFAILGASQYKIDSWKRTTKHETYIWAGKVAEHSAGIALALMLTWFTWIALFATHGDFGPSGEWVPDPDRILSSRTSFFCSIESLFVLLSLSSGIFAEPAGTTRSKKSA